MLSIKENVTTELIINKSKFITYLIKIEKIEDINKELNLLKEEYPEATHYCYAYIYGNTKRFYDDGEPAGTAGRPILSVLEQNQLNNILGVVIRYFGGKKLGTGGLIRAYRNSINECLKETKIIKLVDGVKMKIKFKYENQNKIDYLLKDSQIIKKEFDEYIHYTFLINNDNYHNIFNELKLQTTKMNKIKNILIEK